MWTLKLLDTECCTAKVLHIGRGGAKLISWLDAAGPVDCINRVFDCSTHSTNLQDLEVYLCDHICQLECIKQCSRVESYYRFILTSAHYPFPLTKQTFSSCCQK